MTYHALVSPQGTVEYNAKFVVGDAVSKLEHGRWYSNQELADIACGALFLRDSSGAVEKNVKRWRYERQGEHERGTEGVALDLRMEDLQREA